jgi:uncharacterized protein (TIGR02600 family)
LVSVAHGNHRNRIVKWKMVAGIFCGLVGMTSLLQAQDLSTATQQKLAERALIRVKEQIEEVTGRGAGTTWASQPGAVSLFHSSGRPRSIYKLYSAPDGVASRSSELERDVPADWEENADRYVDLNAPQVSAEGVRFPIADPRADAEGFSYEATIPGVVEGMDDNARLPMPVCWLYVLADGNEGYLDRNNRFVGSVIPTVENPIVGRYGFWTDDNTSRINVNTASEGVFWDTPKVNTNEDRSYGRFQPAQGEYQRYPGHPARVSMSSVLFPDRRYHLPGTDSQLNALSLDDTKAIWSAARGIGSGGSSGGTSVIDTEMTTSIGPSPDSIELYRDPNQLAEILPADAIERVKKGQFFLTNDSRSADVNLLGFPRLTTWPTSNTIAKRTPFDNSIVAVSTIDDGQFFIQRQDAYSRHWEYYVNSGARHERIYEYMKGMTSAKVPGFGGSFADKYGGGRFDDRDQILAQSLGYIRGLNLLDGSSNQQWRYTRGSGAQADSTVGHGQIAAYCLCGGSSDHGARWHNARLQPSLGMGRMIGLSEVAVMLVLRAETMLADENGVVSYVGERNDLEEYGLWNPATGQPEPGKKLVQLGILAEGFAPAHGWTSLQPQNGIAIDGGSANALGKLPATFQLNGQPLEVRRNNRDYPWAAKSANRRPKDWVAWGGYGGVRLFDQMITFEPVVVNSSVERIDFGGSTAREPVRILLFDAQLDQAQTSLNTGTLIHSYQWA